MGIMSLVFGIITCLSACILAPVFAPLAVIFGHIGLARAKNSPVKPAPGKTAAVIGTITGYLGIVMTIILLASMVIFKEPLMQYFQEAAEASDSSF